MLLQSYNPTTWSGTSMHPVESFLFYSVCLMPAFAGFHPLITLAFIVDSGLSAWSSHDGFTWPGTGSQFHMMHHSAFDCNYGNETVIENSLLVKIFFCCQVPLDKWFGTFAAKREDVGEIWKRSDKK